MKSPLSPSIWLWSCCALLLLATPSRADWFGAAWSSRKSVTIDNTLVSETLTDFPVMVRLTTDSDLAADAQDDGDDIVFTSADGTTQLDHEIELFDGTTGELVAWVKLPSISSTVDTVFYLYYGNGSTASQENVTAVWSNSFVSVYHLNDDFDDSVGANNGTNGGSTNEKALIASGQDFERDNSTENIDIGTFSVTGDEITITCWVNPETLDDDERMVSKADGVVVNDHVWLLGVESTTRLRLRLKTGTSDSSGTSSVRSASGVLSAGSWQYAVLKYDGANLRGRLNATEVINTSKTGNLRENAWDVAIGNNPTLNRAWDGIIDEVRISKTHRSDGWNDACYENQRTSSTFLSLGSGEGPEDWTGFVDTDWFDADNWASGIPTAGDNANLPNGLTNYPALTGAGAVCNRLTLESAATLGLGAQTLTVSENVVSAGTITIGTGTLDVAGTFNATGAVTFTGAGRLELGGAVTSLGTLTVTPADCAVVYDSTTIAQTVLATTYQDLVVSNSGQVALTGGDVTVNDDLSVTAGELELDDGDTVTVSDDVTIDGTLDLEPESALLLGNGSAIAVNSGGTFEARGTSSDYALISSASPGVPWRYSFRVNIGGALDAEYAYFRYMDATGLRIDRASDITRLDRSILDEGATSGTLLQVDAATSPKTLASVQFIDSNGDLSFSVATVSSSAALTIDPYDSLGFGGPANENDNGSGTVTPGFIQWGAQTWVQLDSFDAWVTARGGSTGTSITWKTASEINTTAYELEVRPASGNRFVPIPRATIRALGVSPDGAKYHWTDPVVRRPGDEYRLLEIASSGRQREVARATVRERLGLGVPAPPSTSGVPNPLRPLAVGVPLASSVGGSSNRIERIWFQAQQRGIYRVRLSELKAMGLRVTSPDFVRVRRGGVEIPVDVVRTRDSDVEYWFFVEPAPFSDQPVVSYEIDVAPFGTRARIAEESNPGVSSLLDSRGSRTFTWAPQNFYGISVIGGEKRDRWFADAVLSRVPWELTVELPGEVPSATPGRIRLKFELVQWDPLWRSDEWAQVSWNDTVLDTIRLDRFGAHRFECEIPASLLGTSPATLRLQRTTPDGGGSIAWIDSVEVDYEGALQAEEGRFTRLDGYRGTRVTGLDVDRVRVYRWVDGEVQRVVAGIERDFTAGLTEGSAISIAPRYGWGDRVEIHAVAESAARLPRRMRPLPSANAVTPGDLAGVTGIILVSERWRQAGEALAALRSRPGHVVKVVDWESLELARSPEERPEEFLRAFLRDVYVQHGSLLALTLLGDSSYDRRLDSDPRQILPAWLVPATPGVESSIEIASDYRFGELDDSSLGPEIAVGRLPVATAAEAWAMVDKLREQPVLDLDPRIGRWVAVCDRALEFELDLEFAFDDSSGFPWSAVLETRRLSAGTADDLERQLLRDWRDGLDVVTYFGHGSRTTWSGESVLATGRVSGLNGPRVPLVVAFNCLNGFFHHPNGHSLSEALVLSPNSGALAFWGTAGVGSRLAQRRFARHFIEASQLPADTLGSLLREVHRAAREAGTPRFELERWVLIGDPMLPLARP